MGVWGVKPQEATKTVENKSEESDTNTKILPFMSLYSVQSQNSKHHSGFL